MGDWSAEASSTEATKTTEDYQSEAFGPGVRRTESYRRLCCPRAQSWILECSCGKSFGSAFALISMTLRSAASARSVEAYPSAHV
eukprot:4683765-Prorocentrum_lima.AAC.1